ncbi:unnamed protein product [Callosobruchus maculatus]|uniref:Uncharacterized protein n=1 Tax=Callosobruchus maculatus TaxID=64391 RepID=A0A653BHU0_CALMS|nr:unnamed protein product [Callosobruchus maculatus]
MGRRNAGFRKNASFHGKANPNQQNGQNEKTRKPYNDIIRENEKFVKYYEKQGVCKPEEFNSFIASHKTDLPATFRITGSKTVAKKMLEIVQDH